MQEYEQLRALTRVEGRSMADVLREAICEYVQRRASHDEFRAPLEEAMQANDQLIAELAEH